jgi:nucleoid DNA-binding protein
LTKADIVRQIAQATGMTKTDTGAVVDGFIESVIAALAADEHIEIRGFGTFKVVDRAPRTGRNPRSGSEVKISGRKAPTFKPSKELRNRVSDGDSVSPKIGDDKDAVWQEEKAA